MTPARRQGLSAAVLVMVAILAARSGAAGDAGEKVRAYVGGEPVTAGELDELARGAMADLGPKERLGYAIKRKALVQRALKEGVYKEKSYQERMSKAREDALVRTLLEKKSRELAGKITATDEEVAVFSRRMCYTVTFMRKEFGEMGSARRFMAKERLGRPQEWDGQVTVVGCENIGPLMADTLFSMEPDEERVIARGRRFTVVRLIEKKKTTDEAELPDKQRIREFLIEKKTAEVLGNWVDSVVGEARVRYVGGDEAK